MVYLTDWKYMGLTLARPINPVYRLHTEHRPQKGDEERMCCTCVCWGRKDYHYSDRTHDSFILFHILVQVDDTVNA
jgi:hypothetical protein